jgi:hypothetical protein
VPSAGTTHEVAAHVTGIAVEVIRHLEPYLQGDPVPRTRSFEEREAPNRLAFGPEFGMLTAAGSLPLPDPPSAVPSAVLAYAEALGAASLACKGSRSCPPIICGYRPDT